MLEESLVVQNEKKRKIEAIEERKNEGKLRFNVRLICYVTHILLQKSGISKKKEGCENQG